MKDGIRLTNYGQQIVYWFLGNTILVVNVENLQ